MDEVIFEEFKGTGNCEIHLDRKLVRPPDLPGDRPEQELHAARELLLDDATVNRMWVLRKVLSPLSPVDSMEFLLDKVKATDTNDEFLASMNQ